MNWKEADAIILDLGGVILNLDYQRTQAAFEALGLTQFQEMYTQAAQSGLFDEFETGQCSTPYFVNALLRFLPAGTSPNQVVAAWNAMILDFPEENLHLLETLNQQKRLFLLSNTNEIHLQAVNRALQMKSPHSNLAPYFEKVYYSHVMNARKPHPETFLQVCEENKLNPRKTLFVDDTEQHILGAQKVGLHTIHLTREKKLVEIFSI